MRVIGLFLSLAACSYKPQPGLGGTPDEDGPIAGDGPTAVGFTARRSITIAASQVTPLSTGPLIDFPVLVDVAVPGIAAASQAAGADLVFTDAGGVQVLPSELELLGPDRVVAWVKVPSLSNAADTQLFFF